MFPNVGGDNAGYAILIRITKILVTDYKFSLFDAAMKVDEFWKGSFITGDHQISKDTPEYWAEAIFLGQRWKRLNG